MTLFIDLSYFIFYRYFATYSWYKRQQDDETSKDGESSKISVMKDPIFLEKYDKIFEQVIVDLQKKHEIPWTEIYFGKDCTRDEIWRMAHYPAYKQTRDERSQTFDKEIFVHTIKTLIPKIQEKYKGCHMISVPHLEADDIIAILKTYIRQENPEKEIIIITNDNDYIQLADDFTLVVNLQGKDLKTRVDCPPPEYLKRKCIIGDISDNICSIATKIGPKTAEKLANSTELLEKLFIKNPQAKIQHDLNTLLISFESIPESFRTETIESYKKTI